MELLKNYRDRLRQKIADLKRGGLSHDEIARALGIPKNTVVRLAPLSLRRSRSMQLNEYVFRPQPDRILESSMGICPRCQRRKLLPCSACDPNQ